uniref:Uncharacterized protein n=1 Tax=Kalanchoe fedtschenkoi TaxID=63787 RepID=A0A7N1A8U0_KALFE
MLHTIGLAAGSLSALVEEAIVTNFLGLSALDSNKLVVLFYFFFKKKKNQQWFSFPIGDSNKLVIGSSGAFRSW